MNGLIGHGDFAWRREDVRDDLLGFSWTAHVGSDQGCELGLGVRADDTDHIDNPLELTRVADELASEYGVFDRGVRRGLWPQRFQMLLKLQRVSEILFDR